MTMAPVDCTDQGFSREISQSAGLTAIAMNLVVYPLLVAWTLLDILLFPLVFLLGKWPLRWETGRIVRGLIWVYGRGWLLIMAPFVTFRSAGFETLRDQPPCIFVVNHLSFFDTYCMGLLPIYDVVFAVRAWPFRMPWYGWVMRLADYLDVESSSFAETLVTTRRVVAGGGHILFFPEGHRSRDGRLQHFYGGAFRLAAEIGLPVVPLVLTGTGQLLPPGRFWLRPATVTLRALPAIDSTAFGGPEAFRKLRRTVREAMSGALTEGPEPAAGREN